MAGQCTFYLICLDLFNKCGIIGHNIIHWIIFDYISNKYICFFPLARKEVMREEEEGVGVRMPSFECTRWRYIVQGYGF